MKLDELDRDRVLAVNAATIDRMLGDVKIAASGGKRRRSSFYTAIRREVPIPLGAYAATRAAIRTAFEDEGIEFFNGEAPAARLHRRPKTPAATATGLMFRIVDRSLTEVSDFFLNRGERFLCSPTRRRRHSLKMRLERLVLDHNLLADRMLLLSLKRVLTDFGGLTGSRFPSTPP